MGLNRRLYIQDFACLSSHKKSAIPFTFLAGSQKVAPAFSPAADRRDAPITVGSLIS
jgi:hypothetical protein